MTDPKEKPIDPITRCCANCVYWDKRVDDGLCRRAEPRWVPGEAITKWPNTMAMDWCGQFMNKL